MFFAYDIRARKLLYAGYPGPARYLVFARSTGRVYFTPGLAGPLYRYDPEAGGPPVKLDVSLGLRSATQETPQGCVYTVSKGDATLWRLDLKTEKVEKLSSAIVGSQTYITTLDADPTGRFLYYIPGAHGGSERDGAAVVQYDVLTRRKKVIAFLHPFLKNRYGYTPLGTFGSAVAPAGDKLYITWNGNLGGQRRGRLTWDACALTVIHIPPSERSPAGQPGTSFLDATDARGLTEPLRGIMAHAAACGDIDGDGDLDLYVSNNSKRTGLRLANKLFENTGDGRFRDVSDRNPACLVMGGRSIGVLDFDGDAPLDLLVAEDKWVGGRTRLFRNKGAMAFEDATARAGLPADLPALGVITPHLDLDGWPDIFLSQANRLFLSRGDGRYREAGSRPFQYPPIN